jgi:hypothetical protein
MPISLNPKCRGRLITAVAACLTKVMVNNKKYVDLNSCSCLHTTDNILPITGQLRTSLIQWVDETPASTFFADRISGSVSESASYDSNSGMQPLLEVSGYGEPDRLAETLVSELCTLPWKYALTLGFYFPLADKLLHVLPNEGDTFALGESLRIVRPDATYPQMFPLVSGVEGRDRRIYRRGLFAPTIDPSEWNYGRAYLVLEKEGYVPMWARAPH